LLALQDVGGFREQPEVSILLTVLKNAFNEPNQRLPALSAAFICQVRNDACGNFNLITLYRSVTKYLPAQAAEVLLKPEHRLYKPLNRFLLQRPALDMKDVPMFYELFNSGAPHNFKQDRAWVLRMLYRYRNHCMHANHEPFGTAAA